MGAVSKLDPAIYERILYFSPDEKLQKIITFSLESSFRLDTITFSNTNDLINFLKKKSESFSALIYEAIPNDYTLSDVLKFVDEGRKIQKNLPIFFIGKKDSIESVLPNSNQCFFVEKEDMIKGLCEQIKKVFKIDKNYDPEEFCKVRISTLQAFDGISNDLYIQLTSGRFLKLFQKGDEISESDVAKYIDKGIENLYLKQKTCRWVLDQIHNQMHFYTKSKNFKFILRSPELPPEKQFEQKIIRSYDQLHVSDDYRKEVEMRAQRAIAAIKNHPKFKNPMALLKLTGKSQDYLGAHTALLIIACASIAKQMGWHSDITLEKLVYASILHDISLAHKPHLAEIQDLEELTGRELSKEDKKLVLEHPSEVASVVKTSFQFAPADTDVIIFQHHERPDGSGFPKKITAGRINPLSTLFIIAHDMVKYILEHDQLDIDDFILKAEQKFNSISFNKVLTSLKKLKNKK